MKTQKIKIINGILRNLYLNIFVILVLLLMFFVYGCDLLHSEIQEFYSSKVTLVTDLDSIKKGSTNGILFLTKKNEYPATIIDSNEPHTLNTSIRLYNDIRRYCKLEF